MSTVLVDLLTKMGHDVVRAENGDQALDFVAQQQPEIVILDWMMPGMTGLEVCRRIRAIDVEERCKIMMLTSRDSYADVEQALAAGADDYLFKPLDANMLKTRLAIVASHERAGRSRKDQ